MTGRSVDNTLGITMAAGLNGDIGHLIGAGP